MIASLLLSTALLTLAAWLVVWSRRDTVGRMVGAIGFPLAVLMSGGIAYLPLGEPIPMAPLSGTFQVYGGRVVKDVAIYVLLGGDGDEPTYYRLPYVEGDAEKLQTLLANGDVGTISFNSDGNDISLGGEEVKAPEHQPVLGGS